MASRRRFLIAASAVGAAGIAGAWAGWAMSESRDAATSRKSRAKPTDATACANCIYLCPIALLSSGGGQYYYNCKCCPSGGTQVVVTNGALPDACVQAAPCGQGQNYLDNCCMVVGLGHSPSPAEELQKALCSADMLLSPLAMDRPGGRLVSGSYVSGIQPVNAREFDDSIRRGSIRDTRIEVSYATYRLSNRTRHVALYDLSFGGTDSLVSGRRLRIGQEVQNVPPGVRPTSPVNVTSPFFAQLPCYRQLWKDSSDNSPYHVAIQA
jgi:hypothetical protein